MPDQSYLEWAKAAQTDALIKGALLEPDLPHDYVGAALVVRAALFFPNAYLSEVRANVARCFDDYSAVAGERLRWVTQDGVRPVPLKGGKPDPNVFMPKRENDLLSAVITSGEKPADAGLWEFRVFGLMKWQEPLANSGRSVLTFSVPIPFLTERPTEFQRLFVDFSRRLDVVSGYAGLATNLSVPEAEANTPTEYWLSKRYIGMDVGDPLAVAMHLRSGIKTVSWLTAINKDLLEKVGGIHALRSELPPDWFAFYDVNGGVVIQAGPMPEAGALADEQGAGVPVPPASYVVLNNALKSIRVPSVWQLQRGLMGAAAPIYKTTAESDEWLRRFDVPADELLNFKARLLDQSKLTDGSVLPDRL